jgi:hypothetical protein
VLSAANAETVGLQAVLAAEKEERGEERGQAAGAVKKAAEAWAAERLQFETRVRTNIAAAAERISSVEAQKALVEVRLAAEVAGRGEDAARASAAAEQAEWDAACDVEAVREDLERINRHVITLTGSESSLQHQLETAAERAEALKEQAREASRRLNAAKEEFDAAGARAAEATAQSTAALTAAEEQLGNATEALEACRTEQSCLRQELTECKASGVSAAESIQTSRAKGEEMSEALAAAETKRATLSAVLGASKAREAELTYDLDAARTTEIERAKARGVVTAARDAAHTLEVDAADARGAELVKDLAASTAREQALADDVTTATSRSFELALELGSAGDKCAALARQLSETALRESRLAEELDGSKARAAELAAHLATAVAKGTDCTCELAAATSKHDQLAKQLEAAELRAVGLTEEVTERRAEVSVLGAQIAAAATAADAVDASHTQQCAVRKEQLDTLDAECCQLRAALLISSDAEAAATAAALRATRDKEDTEARRVTLADQVADLGGRVKQANADAATFPARVQAAAAADNTDLRDKMRDAQHHAADLERLVELAQGETRAITVRSQRLQRALTDGAGDGSEGTCGSLQAAVDAVKAQGAELNKLVGAGRLQLAQIKARTDHAGCTGSGAHRGGVHKADLADRDRIDELERALEQAVSNRDDVAAAAAAAAAAATTQNAVLERKAADQKAASRRKAAEQEAKFESRLEESTRALEASKREHAAAAAVALSERSARGVLSPSPSPVFPSFAAAPAASALGLPTLTPDDAAAPATWAAAPRPNVELAALREALSVSCGREAELVAQLAALCTTGMGRTGGPLADWLISIADPSAADAVTAEWIGSIAAAAAAATTAAAAVAASPAAAAAAAAAAADTDTNTEAAHAHIRSNVAPPAVSEDARIQSVGVAAEAADGGSEAQDEVLGESGSEAAQVRATQSEAEAARCDIEVAAAELAVARQQLAAGHLRMAQLEAAAEEAAAEEAAAADADGGDGEGDEGDSVPLTPAAVATTQQARKAKGKGKKKGKANVTAAATPPAATTAAAAAAAAGVVTDASRTRRLAREEERGSLRERIAALEGAVRAGGRTLAAAAASLAEARARESQLDAQRDGEQRRQQQQQQPGKTPRTNCQTVLSSAHPTLPGGGAETVGGGGRDVDIFDEEMGRGAGSGQGRPEQRAASSSDDAGLLAAELAVTQGTLWKTQAALALALEHNERTVAAARPASPSSPLESRIQDADGHSSLPTSVSDDSGSDEESGRGAAALRATSAVRVAMGALVAGAAAAVASRHSTTTGAAPLATGHGAARVSTVPPALVAAVEALVKQVETMQGEMVPLVRERDAARNLLAISTRREAALGRSLKALKQPAPQLASRRVSFGGVPFDGGESGSAHGGFNGAGGQVQAQRRGASYPYRDDESDGDDDDDDASPTSSTRISGGGSRSTGRGRRRSHSTQEDPRSQTLSLRDYHKQLVSARGNETRVMNGQGRQEGWGPELGLGRGSGLAYAPGLNDRVGLRGRPADWSRGEGGGGLTQATAELEAELEAIVEDLSRVVPGMGLPSGRLYHEHRTGDGNY